VPGASDKLASGGRSWAQPATCSAMREDPSIRHVSDTAFWVASFRALEGTTHQCRIQRSGVRDPYRVSAAVPSHVPCRAALTEWGVIIRTSAIDRLISEALAAGVDTVLNLGAGLDSRPYRMILPASLRWVELDFPDHHRL
jgi:O-methyltransferase involved in polyketide biosynthesis